MSFSYLRTIRLADTDAAGVIYFANMMSICHEAYEEALAIAGIDLKMFFNNSLSAIPIIRAQLDFFRPIFCGDKVLIYLIPQQLSKNEFEIYYQIVTASSPEECLAKASTKHVCIDPNKRTRQEMPKEIIEWLTSHQLSS
jgi:1,4-dihydroxy-2-naphthoyl-CoA hydrolase